MKGEEIMFRPSKKKFPLFELPMVSGVVFFVHDAHYSFFNKLIFIFTLNARARDWGNSLK
jgi:hypothetical protein